MDAPAQHRPPGPAPWSRGRWLALAAGLLAVASVLAFWQMSRPLPVEPEPESWAAWLLHPHQLNAGQRLPVIDADLLDVAALDARRVWAVGRHGTIVHSSDGGETWVRQPIDTPSVPSGPQRQLAPGKSPPSGAWLWQLTGGRNAYAAEPPAVPLPPPPNAPAYPDAANAANQSSPSRVQMEQEKKARLDRELRDKQQRDKQEKEAKRGSQSSGGGGAGPRVPNAAPATPAARGFAPSDVQAIPLPAVPSDPASPASAVLIAVWVGRGSGGQVRGYALSDQAEVFHLVDNRWATGLGPVDSEDLVQAAVGAINRLSVAVGRRDVLPPLQKAQFSGKAWRALDASGQLAEALAPTDALRFADPGGVDAFHADRSGHLAVAKADEVRVTLPTSSLAFRVTLPFRARAIFLGGFRTDGPQPLWAAGDSGQIAGFWNQIWTPPHLGGPSLNAVFFLPDDKTGWAVGDSGSVLGTRDGGRSWAPLTRGALVNAAAAFARGTYLRLPPPWYALAWLGFALLLVRVARRPPDDLPPPNVSVADEWTSDRPLEPGAPDPLGFGRIALGLSGFLRNENTLAPLTIAITGEWGTGKSSLMNLLRADLVTYGFAPVWFNAWHHQKEEHLLASLLQGVRLQAVPSWLSLAGVTFRLRLLLIRGWRNLAAVLLLAAVVAGLVAFEVGHVHQDPAVRGATKGGLLELVERLISDGGQAPAVPSAPTPAPASDPAAGAALAPAAGGGTSHLALLLSGALGLLSLWRGFKPFGISPASLLSSAAGALKVRDLDAQTSFRQRFATEFDDVTRALGDRPMIIFVDDLDRCRPTQVLDVLEAINFLVSSGQCYVVMGMARTRVEPTIALSFKDIAEEMSDAGADAAAPPTEETRRRRRAAYARQYLDKLINIEIPVPAPSGDQARALLDNARPDTSRPDAVAARRLRVLRGLVPVVLLVAFVVLGAAVGTWVGGQQPSDQPPSRPATAAATASPAADDAATGGAPGNPASPGGRARTPGPTARVARDPAVLAAQTGRVYPPRALPAAVAPAALTALGILLLLGTFFVIARRRPELVVRDSPAFARALGDWHPLIFRSHPTPRALKRFRNRVRYLAMLQRPPAPPAEPPSGWLAWLRRAVPSAPRIPPALGSAPPSTPIPEDVLVALAALDDAGWKRPYETPDPIVDQLLSDPGEVSRILSHRDAFVRASAGVSVH